MALASNCGAARSCEYQRPAALLLPGWTIYVREDMRRPAKQTISWPGRLYASWFLVRAKTYSWHPPIPIASSSSSWPPNENQYISTLIYAKTCHSFYGRTLHKFYIADWTPLSINFDFIILSSHSIWVSKMRNKHKHNPTNYSAVQYYRSLKFTSFEMLWMLVKSFRKSIFWSFLFSLLC